MPVPAGYYISTVPELIDARRIYEMLKGFIWSKEQPVEYVQRFISYSLCFGVYTDGSNELVGFGRVITDYTTEAYVCDIAIIPVHQRKGLATALFNEIMKHPQLKGIKEWSLRVTEQARAIYERSGFRVAPEPENILEDEDLNIYTYPTFVNLFVGRPVAHLDSFARDLANGYSIKSAIDIVDVWALLRETEALRGIPIEYVERLVQHSFCLGIYHNESGRLVGFGRAITDYTTYAHVCDIVIAPAHRRRRLASALFKMMREHPEMQGFKAWSLKTTPEARPIFERAGFKLAVLPNTILAIDDHTFYMRADFVNLHKKNPEPPADAAVARVLTIEQQDARCRESHSTRTNFLLDC